MDLSKCKVLLTGLLAFAIAVPVVSAQTITSSDDGTVLKQIIIFGRHSVRAPVQPTASLNALASKTYPDFGVPAGYLTPHGQQAEVLLGSYFRDYLLHERLLTGNPDVDLARSYFRANSIQRSNITATAFGSGLFSGVTVPVHSYPLGQVDPVFDPITAKVAIVDPARAATEAKGIFNSGAALASAYSGEYSLIRSVLFGYQNGTQPPPATPSGKLDPTAQPILLDAATAGVAAGNVLNMGGLATTFVAADPFVMQYTNGMPLADVGWGQLSPDTLSQQTRLITLAFNILMQSPYLDQVQSSNAASHVLRSMEQAVINDAIPGAFADPKVRVNVVISSDAYVIGLAGLLRVHWLLPGYQQDFCAPGGALVFELRQSRSSGEYIVRVFYTAQTFDQLRNLTPLTLDAPPATMQLAIPGGRSSAASLDVKFETFQRLMKAAIGPKYVEDPATEVPPSVLTGVPLK